MKYSEFQKRTNPISAARLDAAFEASKMEGGPGDPVEVKIEKDKAAGKVTVSKFSGGTEKEPLTEPEKKAANDRWAAMSEEEKQAARERGKARDVAAAERNKLSSFTYEKLPYYDSPKLELMEEEDIDFNFDYDDTDDTEETPKNNQTGGYTYRVSQGGDSKRGKNKNKLPKCKDKPPGLFSKKFDNSCTF